MIIVKKIDRKGKSLLGLKVELPSAPLIMLIYNDIIIGCAYFSIDTMEKVGNAICIVSGVSDFENVLDAEIKEVSSKAAERGAKVGMKVSEFIDFL